MADLLPNNFPLPAEQVISTYQYTDIADGTGVVDNYIYKASDKDGAVYRLGAELPFSEEIEMVLVNDGPHVFDFYSKPFNTPRVVEGDLIIEYSIVCAGNPGTDTTQWKIYHYDGTTSTQLGDTYSASVTASSNKVAVIPIPLKNFGIADQIRIEFTFSGGAAGRSAAVGLDPQNRDGTYITPSSTNYNTQTKVSIPFKIEV